MSDATDLAALKSALSTFATFLRSCAARMDGAAHATLLNGVADELDYIRLNLAAPTNQVLPPS